MKKGILIGTALFVAVFVFGLASISQAQDQIPTLTTDKADYFPGEVVTIFGNFFDSLQNLVLKIFGGTAEEGNYTETTIPVLTDDQGSFTTTYTLDNVFRPLYTVTASDEEGNQLAQTSFTDAPTKIKLEQCHNFDGAYVNCTDLAGPTNYWGTGNAQSGNAQLNEGDSQNYRIIITDLSTSGIPAGGWMLVIEQDLTKGGKMAQDFWSGPGNIKTAADSVFPYNIAAGVNPCIDNGSATAFCTSGSGVTNITIPSLSTLPSPPAGFSSVIAAQTAFPSVNTISPTPGMHIYGATGSITAYSFSGDFASGDSAIRATIRFTNTLSTVVIAYGGHVSVAADYAGIGKQTATGISGSPYHNRLISFDGINGDTGNQDMQMASTAIVSPDSTSVATFIHNDGDHTTDVQNTIIALGSTIHDKATVTNTGSGGFGTPAGTVTFQYFTNDTCSLPAADTSSALALSSGSVDATGFAKGPLAAGSYSFKAHYTSSDTTKWTDSDGPCEKVTVGQGTPTVVTEIHNASEAVITTSAPAGTTVHDKATVSGSFGTPTGAADFTFYTSGDCTTGGTAAGTGIVLVSGVAHPSSSEGPLNAGSYSFKAHYNGDTNYVAADSTCEPLEVTKVSPTISTTPSAGGVVGITLNDTATLSGGFSPTGNVTFKLFPPSDPTCSGTAAYTDTDSAPPYATSPGFASNAVGVWHWTADYAGDANNNPVSSACADEAVTVTKASPSISTDIHNAAHAVVTSAALGSTVHDSATVSGGFSPSGDVTFTFYTTASNCTGSSVGAGTVALSGGVAHPSSSQGPLAAGSYSFKAHYNGDTNNNEADATCEPLTVNKAQLSLESQVHDASHVDKTNSSVPLGSVMHDTAKISGGVVGGFTPPAITFKSYTNSSCSLGEASVSNTGADEGDATRDRSASSAALAAGSYSYKAFVAGDSNYFGTDSGCEPFTVDKVQLSIGTVIHLDADHSTNYDANADASKSVALNSVVHDKATVSGDIGGFPVPAITFTQWSNGTCDSTGSALGTDGADTGGTRSVDTSALAAGMYSFKAAVASDANYDGATSACEKLVVNKANTEVSTQVHNPSHTDVTNGSVALGTAVHDSASVGPQVNGFVIGGTVTYHFYNDGNCQTTPTDETVAVGNESSATAALGAGPYSYKADYSGDDNYNSSTGDCEPFTVDQGTLTLSTTIHNPDHSTLVGNAALGATLHDRADVGGINGSFAPANSVTFKFYDNNTCDGGSAAGSAAIVAGVAHPSDSKGPLAAGSHAFRAFYDGSTDPNYGPDSLQSDCEPFTVNQATPSVTTELHNNDESVITTEASTSTVHDQATVTGGVASFAPTGNVEFTFYNNGTCASTGSSAGTLALDGTSDPSTVHPSTSEGPLVAGSYSFKAHYVGDSNYEAKDSACEPFTVTTLTINKLANGVDTFGYTVNGPTNATPSITTTNGVSGTTGAIVVFSGNYTVGETTIPAGWIFVSLSCPGTGVVTNSSTSPSFNVPAGTNAVCDFENTKQLATRTQGFWATHTEFSNNLWTTLVPVGEKDMSTWGGTCSGIIDADAATGGNELMGGFWANVANKSPSGKRSAIDKARMQLLQQLEAALLNRYGLGTADGGIIDTAENVYCTGAAAQITAQVGILGNFNQSGDTIPLGTPVPNATPKTSKDQANIPFWNTPMNPNPNL